MTWDVLSIIGTIAFAISGAFIAMEEEYDILGVYILGIVTAFGGGAIRNLLIGVPVSALWEQGLFFKLLYYLSLPLFISKQYLKTLEAMGKFFGRHWPCSIRDSRSALCHSYESSA